MKKTLIAYFSASHSTKKVALCLAALTEADTFEISPEVPYTEADLNWQDRQSRSAREIDNPFSRPRLAATVENIGQYDVLYLGFPIWWYTAPALIRSFLDAHDLSDITIIPFATSEGSKIHRAIAELRRDYPKLHWREGMLLNNPTDKLLKDWTHQQNC